MSFTSFLEGTRWTDVYAAAACSFLTGTAMFTAEFTLALRLQSDGHGGIAVAAMIICAILPLVVLAPLTGRMADRYDSRTLLLGAGAFQAAAISAMPFTDSVPVLLALAFATSSANALIRPTISALVPNMTTEGDLPRAVAMIQTGLLIGMAAGPAASGFVIAHHGSGTALTAAACSAGLSALLACDIRTRRGGIRAGGPEHRDSQRPPWSLRSDRLLMVMVIGTGAAVAALAAINVLEVFLVRETYGASESTYGLINACWTAGMAGGAWVAAAIFRRVTDAGTVAWILMGCLGLTGVVVIAMGAPLPAVAMLIPLYLIGGVLNATENSSMQISVARRVPERYRGRASARINGLVNGASLIGFAVGGALETAMDVQAAFIAAGLATIVVVAACVPLLRRGVRTENARETESEPEPQLASV